MTRGHDTARPAQQVDVVDDPVPAPVPASARGSAAPWVSACSMTSVPPSRSSSRGAGGHGQRQGEPVGAAAVERLDRVVVADLGVDGTWSSGMYGGLQVTTSTASASSGYACRASPRSTATSSPSRSRFRTAHAWARSVSSTAYTVAAGHSALTASAMAPDPVARSTTTGASRPASERRARSTSSSVSGRGTKTPGPTSSSSPRKYARPVRCCSGTRLGALGDEVRIPLRRLDPTEDHEPPGLADVLAAQVGGEVQGVDRGGLDAGLGEGHGARRRTRRSATAPHAPATAARRACSSASTQEPMTASRSPSSTWSRL